MTSDTDLKFQRDKKDMCLDTGFFVDKMIKNEDSYKDTVINIIRVVDLTDKRRNSFKVRMKFQEEFAATEMV